MPTTRRALRVAAAVTALATAYVGGVVTGLVGDGDPAPAAARPGVIDQAADRIAARAARPVDRETLERAAVEGMLRTLGDRWSTYYGRAEFSSFSAALQGRYAGVGLWLRDAADASGGSVEVGSVQPGSPAAAAGVVAGDVVLAVDGEDVRRAGVPAVAAMLRGEDRSGVRLQVRRGSATRTLGLTRAVVSTPDVTVDRLDGDVTRLAVTAFSRGVGRDVAVALERVGPTGGVVLDLRGNPGGLLDEAVAVASAFLDGGPVVSYERRGSRPQFLDAYDGGDTVTPLVVLVDAATASAAEVVAAALQDRNRAVVVGTRTYGKGSVQEPSRLSDGSALELTVGWYVTPGGRSLEGVGVEPDVLVPPGEAPGTAEERATGVLAGLVAAVKGTGRG